MPFDLICDGCESPFTRRSDPRKDRRTAHIFCSRKCYWAWKRQVSDVECERCGKTYRPYGLNHGHRFCSWACYAEMRADGHQLTKLCPECGKSFTVRAAYEKRYTHCSDKCRRASGWGDGTQESNCENCGAPFRHHENRYDRHFCSEECRRPTLTIHCATCGGEFRISPYAKATRRFCSVRCFRTFQGESSLERQMRESLERLGLEYIQEGRVGDRRVDFLLTTQRIALEVDHVYWHQDTEKDARKTAYLRKEGWRVCRITNEEMADTEHLDGLVAGRLQGVASLDL